MVEVEEYDDRGNTVYKMSSEGLEEWREYNDSNRMIHYKNWFDERWWEYDEDNNKIHFKVRNGKEEWYKSNELNSCIRITEEEFKNIREAKVEKEFLSREEILRFDLMEF